MPHCHIKYNNLCMLPTFCVAVISRKNNRGKQVSQAALPLTQCKFD